MHPEPMNANMPSASAARVGLAKFVTDMEIEQALDLCRIATNTGESQRGVNAEIAMGRRDGDSIQENLCEEFDAAVDCRAVDDDSRGVSGGR
jgi:hypothetical protein